MWREEDNKLKRSFRFKDFKEAFVFMTDVAEVSEAMDHHPWWSNMYNLVEIELFTHDSGNTVTERDRQLAERIDQIANSFEG